eukprot:8581514-Alexandrium_andersonii.AAC.1
MGFVACSRAQRVEQRVASDSCSSLLQGRADLDKRSALVFRASSVSPRVPRADWMGISQQVGFRRTVR